MIQELINFTENLDEEFKTIGSLPKEGIHILLHLKKGQNNEICIDVDDFQYEQFSKKQKDSPSTFLNKCKLMQQNSWMVDTNKCLDTITRAIHTCSPFSIAIKRDNLYGGKNFEKRKKEGKNIVYDSFDPYFSKAFTLFEDEIEKEKYIIFKNFFINGDFTRFITKIEDKNATVFQQLEERIGQLKLQLKETKEKTAKEIIKETINQVDQQLLKVKPLDDSNYIIFYLDVPIERYKQVHKKYLDDKLFNTDKFNTAPDEQGLIYGTNNFMNSFNGNMPFLLHRTASFDITGRISNIEAKLLNDLQNIFPNKTLPNPLPIFIYKEELQNKVISIFRESNFKFSYKEIVQKILEINGEDLTNYYLLFWQRKKVGNNFKTVFYDFDYIVRFEYEIRNLTIQNLFEIKEKGGKTNKHYPLIKTIFDLEQQILKPLIENKYFKVDYFKDLDPEDYKDRTKTPNIHYSNRFISYSKYRKAIYDFVYKSQRNAIDRSIFYEMVFNSVLDDIKNGNGYGIKEKLNIWYSLHKYFNPKQKINMVNKLKEYQDFVADLISGEELIDVTDEKFAFAAGQVIEYILSKSKSADNSYNLLEPYLQQSKCSEFKNAIANDFGRYKHENFSRNFEKVAAFVLSYETDVNLKHLLPQILSGAFSKNQLFSSTNKN